MQKEHIYRGKVDPGGDIEVTVDGEHSLGLFLDVLPESNREPAIFSWGTETPGCVRLAFSLLYHASSKNKNLASKWRKEFCDEKIEKLNRNDSWEMSSQCINDWTKKKQHEELGDTEPVPF